MSQANRVETMAAKLATYARRSDIDPLPLVAAYDLAVRHRLARLGDVFHRDLLHPARTALILLEDVEGVDAHSLAAAALVESEFPDLRVTGRALQREDLLAPAGLAAAVPTPDVAGERLTEELVLASPLVAGIALAERLDHARHLHFRAPSAWRPFLELIDRVYLPCAQRDDGALARRYERWRAAFERRL